MGILSCISFLAFYVWTAALMGIGGLLAIVSAANLFPPIQLIHMQLSFSMIHALHFEPMLGYFKAP